MFCGRDIFFSEDDCPMILPGRRRKSFGSVSFASSHHRRNKLGEAGCFVLKGCQLYTFLEFNFFKKKRKKTIMIPVIVFFFEDVSLYAMSRTQNGWCTFQRLMERNDNFWRAIYRELEHQFSPFPFGHHFESVNRWNIF